jgi:hypothetical protein
MHDMPFSVNHNIPIVTVLNLEDITSNRIGGHRLDEIEASALELNGLFSTIF